jgi:hypothetical protein
MQLASGWQPLGVRWAEDRGDLRDGDKFPMIFVPSLEQIA